MCVRQNKSVEPNFIQTPFKFSPDNKEHMISFEEFIYKKKPENRPNKYENENQTNDAKMSKGI